MMPHPHVTVERDPAGYLRILLARPDRRNALDLGMVEALLAAFASDPAAVAVLGSADPLAFCAGADLAITDAERARVSDLLYQCYEVIVTRPGPVLAVVDGPAVGGGAQLAAAADLRVAGPKARFRWAGPPSPALAVGAWVLPALVGRGVAMELTLTGRWVDVTEAAELGLVNWVDDQPAELADRVARSLGPGGDGGTGQAGAGQAGAGQAGAGQAGVGQVKAITAAGGLLETLHAERAANSAAWARQTLAST
jgi:enoyl-CoA hydratase